MRTAPTRESLRWVPLALLGVIIAVVGALFLGWLPSAPWICRGFPALFGLFTLAATLTQPSWFWNSRRARMGRSLLGDRLYASFLLALGLGLVYLGLVSDAMNGCTVEVTGAHRR